jgi:hypothetical protein
MMNSFARFLPKLALGVLLASGITGAVAASAQPAQAGVAVSIGIGGGYAPNYHWYRWHDGYGWHRRWVPLTWAPPVAYAPVRPAYYGPAYYRPGYVRAGWGRSGYWVGGRYFWR